MPYFEPTKTRGGPSRKTGSGRQTRGSDTVGGAQVRPVPIFDPGPLGENARALVTYLDHVLSLMAYQYDVRSRSQFEINLQRLEEEIQYLITTDDSPLLLAAKANCMRLWSDVTKAFGTTTAGHDAQPNDLNLASAHGLLAEIGRQLDQLRS